MPFPSAVDDLLSCNKLICDEMVYDRASLLDELRRCVGLLIDEQRDVYDTIVASINSNKGGVFFLYGYGGTGKTFVWKTHCAALRSRGDIVINVASSGIASLLLPSGRTAHSRFAIPLSPDENSTCNINQGSSLAQLISRTKLIIWNEAPMMNKYCFEALERSMRDILSFDNPNSLEEPFRGKTVIFGGDFRQILPVCCASYMQGRAILAPRNDDVDVVNEYMVSMLLRNIDHTQGLCNVIRLIIMRLGDHVLESQILSGSNAGHKFFIPMMSLSPFNSRIPVRFQRRQFPLTVSYAMTINKSRRQSLSHVGLLLKRPIFTHGQL